MSLQFLKNGQIYDSGECVPGLNLLAHAQLIELDIGSQCGGHGKCGKDRVILASSDQKKVNPPTQIELHQLSAAELMQGYRLACQCFPNTSDLRISAQIPPKE